MKPKSVIIVIALFSLTSVSALFSQAPLPFSQKMTQRRSDSSFAAGEDSYLAECYDGLGDYAKVFRKMLKENMQRLAYNDYRIGDVFLSVRAFLSDLGDFASRELNMVIERL